MKPEIITLANKVLHDLNFDKTRTTTQIVAEAISNYAEQQVKTCNKPQVSKCVSMCRNIKCTVDDCPHIVNDDIKCPLSERVDLVCGKCLNHVSMTI